MCVGLKEQFWGVMSFFPALWVLCIKLKSWMPVTSPAEPLFWVLSLAFQLPNYKITKTTHITPRKGEGSLRVISRQWGGNSQVVLMPGPHDFALRGSGLLHGLPTALFTTSHPRDFSLPLSLSATSPPLTLSVWPFPSCFSH